MLRDVQSHDILALVLPSPNITSLTAAAQSKRKASASSQQRPKGKAPASQQGADPHDSSEDDAAHNGEKPQSVASSERRFDKDAVLSAVETLHRKAPELLPADMLAEWQSWHASAPTTCSEVADAKHPLPLRMPMKCSPSPNEPAPLRAAAQQQQLLTYQNPEGQGYTKDARARDALAAISLKEDDVPVGSTVALRRPPQDEGVANEPGYDTLFYLADVVSVELSDGPKDHVGSREVASLEVHYRMPFRNGKACDDEHRAWHPICVGHHQWAHMCEARGQCVKLRENYALSLRRGTSKYMVVADPLSVFETKIDFTQGGQLSAGSKKRLRTGASTSGMWDERLGIRDAPQRPQKGLKK